MTVNLNNPEWDVQRSGWRFMHVGRRLGGKLLGATLFDAPAGTSSHYHFHHANEEMLIALGGRVILRTPDDERQVKPGEIALFPRGPDGAHAIANGSDEPARYLVISSMVEPDVLEYPDAKATGVIVGDAPTAGRDAPLELFFPRNASIPYGRLVQPQR
jgi:uncharacterized cupin superfamily protein